MESLKRWWPLVAILALAFNLRPVAVAIGPVLAEISADIGLDGVTAGLLTSLPTLCFAAFGALAPWVSQRIGVVPTVGLALAALLAGQVGRLLTHSPGPFLALSALALAGMALANVLMPTLVRLHYPHRVGTATALYSLTLTLGVTMASAATVPIASIGAGATPSVWSQRVGRAGRLDCCSSQRPRGHRQGHGRSGGRAHAARRSRRLLRHPVRRPTRSSGGSRPSSARWAQRHRGAHAGHRHRRRHPARVVPVRGAPQDPSRLFLTIICSSSPGTSGLLAPSSTPCYGRLRARPVSFPLILARSASAPALPALLCAQRVRAVRRVRARHPWPDVVRGTARGDWLVDGVDRAPTRLWRRCSRRLYACRPVLVEDELGA